MFVFFCSEVFLVSCFPQPEQVPEYAIEACWHINSPVPEDIEGGLDGKAASPKPRRPSMTPLIEELSILRSFRMQKAEPRRSEREGRVSSIAAGRLEGPTARTSSNPTAAAHAVVLAGI